MTSGRAALGKLRRSPGPTTTRRSRSPGQQEGRTGAHEHTKGIAMTDRIRVDAAELKRLWFDDRATGMVHDHQTNEKVVRFEDGTEYACALDDPEAYR